jgi:hypothetical protein
MDVPWSLFYRLFIIDAGAVPLLKVKGHFALFNRLW